MPIKISQNITRLSLWQQGLLGRLGIRNLVDDEANTTLGDDVRNAIANLDVHNLCRSICRHKTNVYKLWIRHSQSCLLHSRLPKTARSRRENPAFASCVYTQHCLSRSVMSKWCHIVIDSRRGNKAKHLGHCCAH